MQFVLRFLYHNHKCIYILLFSCLYSDTTFQQLLISQTFFQLSLLFAIKNLLFQIEIRELTNIISFLGLLCSHNLTDIVIYLAAYYYAAWATYLPTMFILLIMPSSTSSVSTWNAFMIETNPEVDFSISTPGEIAEN